MKTNFISTHFSHPNWRTLCYDRRWLPHIFTGKFVTAAFWFNKHDNLSRHRLITSLLS